MLFMNHLGKLAVVAGIVLGAAPTANSAMPTDLPPVGVVSGPKHELVIVRAIFKFHPHDGGIKADPIVVILDPFTEAIFDDTELLAPPTISNAIMPFGNVKLTELLDNNLVRCGGGGNEQCERARVRVYTTGVAGAGFWNTVGGYGAPLWAQAPGGSYVVVGLGTANAAYMNSTDISALNAFYLSDMYDSIIPPFNFRSDFRQAGTGTYSTEVVMDVVLDIP